MTPQTTDESMLPWGFFLAWLAITVGWWALALAPAPAVPPDWLVVARQVCFGATATGLPDTYGWLVLCMAPASLLGFLLVVWGQQLGRNLRTLSHTPRGRLAVGLVAVVPLVGVVLVAQRVSTAQQVRTALEPEGAMTALPENWPYLARPAPALHLLDQQGRPTTLTDAHGNILILTFAFAHCQTICPAIVHTARAALQEAAGSAPHLWVITLDPWRDTPGALPTLAAEWQVQGDRMRVLSGEVDTVLAVLNAYNVPYQRDLKNGDIAHAALVYVIDTTGQIAYAFNNPSRAWLTEAIRRIARHDPS